MLLGFGLCLFMTLFFRSNAFLHLFPSRNASLLFRERFFPVIFIEVIRAPASCFFSFGIAFVVTLNQLTYFLGLASAISDLRSVCSLYFFLFCCYYQIFLSFRLCWAIFKFCIVNYEADDPTIYDSMISSNFCYLIVIGQAIKIVY